MGVLRSVQIRMLQGVCVGGIFLKSAVRNELESLFVLFFSLFRLVFFPCLRVCFPVVAGCGNTRAKRAIAFFRNGGGGRGRKLSQDGGGAGNKPIEKNEIGNERRSKGEERRGEERERRSERVLCRVSSKVGKERSLPIKQPSALLRLGKAGESLLCYYLFSSGGLSP